MGLVVALTQLGPPLRSEGEIAKSPIYRHSSVLLGCEIPSLFDSANSPVDHRPEREGGVHCAEVDGLLPVLEHNIGVGSDHSGEGIHAIDSPESFYSFLRLADLILLTQGVLDVLQDPHEGLVGLVKGLSGRAGWFAGSFSGSWA